MEPCLCPKKLLEFYQIYGWNNDHFTTRSMYSIFINIKNETTKNHIYPNVNCITFIPASNLK